MKKVLAIVCVKNEAIHIRRCLRQLIEEGVDVVLIDDGSTDQSVDIAKTFLGRGLVRIKTLPGTVEFSLSDQLRAKHEVVAETDYDWYVHVDADEWLCSSLKGQSLYEGIVEADAAGYTAINFHELVFVPLPGEDFFVEDYASRMLNYYFFQPSYPRLNRAWSRQANLQRANFGGHLLYGNDLRLFPRDFFLRHYIALSENHAQEKYLGRRYSDEDIERGWHGKRMAITPENLRFKRVPGLFRLDDPAKHSFDLSMPIRHHFWEW